MSSLLVTSPWASTVDVVRNNNPEKIVMLLEGAKVTTDIEVNLG
jgi:hypothetical protein